MKDKKIKLIVHGGAWNIPQDMHKAHLSGVEKAAEEGLRRLLHGKDAISSVIETVKILENDSTFDAGIGSFLNVNGEVEMDAIIMEGKKLSFGSVAAIQNVQNPIDAANIVRLKTEYNFLAGKGAGDFAYKNGIEFCATEHLLVGRELDRYNKLKRRKQVKSKEFFEYEFESHDTVGAVAIDADGLIAVATSTGGTPNKLPGRVGDSPLIGAGAYADNNCAGASSTGWGESLMQVLLAKTCVDFVQQGNDAQKAADLSISLLKSRVDGRGGIIVIDKTGNAGFAYNTPYMSRRLRIPK